MAGAGKGGKTEIRKIRLFTPVKEHINQKKAVLIKM
jgi:hypothetical protein